MIIIGRSHRKKTVLNTRYISMVAYGFWRDFLFRKTLVSQAMKWNSIDYPHDANTGIETVLFTLKISLFTDKIMLKIAGYIYLNSDWN